MKKATSFLCGGALLLSMLCATPVHAEPDTSFFKTEQHGLFHLRYLNQDGYAELMDDANVPVKQRDKYNSAFKTGELKMLPAGFEYWSAMLEPYAKSTANLDIALLDPRDDNASAAWKS